MAGPQREEVRLVVLQAAQGQRLPDSWLLLRLLLLLLLFLLFLRGPAPLGLRGGLPVGRGGRLSLPPAPLPAGLRLRPRLGVVPLLCGAVPYGRDLSLPPRVRRLEVEPPGVAQVRLVRVRPAVLPVQRRGPVDAQPAAGCPPRRRLGAGGGRLGVGGRGRRAGCR